MTRMRETVTSKTYDIWSLPYDYTFAPLVVKRLRRAIAQLRLRPGDRVLDMGVGTGSALGFYPKNVTIVGLDLSAGMLAKAADKCREQGLTHCQLLRGDALNPPFAPGSFDHVVITHVISVVSDPHRLLSLAARLVKPGGRIVVLNHFQSSQPVVAWFERVLNPIFVKIGWRSDLRLDELLRGVDLKVEYQFKIDRLDLFQIVVLNARPQSSPPEPTANEMPDLGSAATAS
ncbi:MAG: methyltransferase domain-containing protein [Planctomycetota bacterium]|nr:methyltransferase domain-containing protein [Planctomycetota bacterium]